MLTIFTTFHFSAKMHVAMHCYKCRELSEKAEKNLHFVLYSQKLKAINIKLPILKGMKLGLFCQLIYTIVKIKK